MGSFPIRAVLVMRPDWRPLRASWSCPGPEQLAAFADGRVSPPARDEIEEHVADCDACLSALGLLTRAADAPPPPVPEALLRRLSSQTAHSVWSAHRWTAAAAGILLVAGVGLVWQGSPETGPAAPAPEVRGLAATEVRLLAPTAGSSFSRERGDVRWMPVPRALYYEVKLTDLDGALAWEGRTEASEIVIPAEVLQSFSTGFVWVTAHQPDNRSVRSPAMAVTVAPR